MASGLRVTARGALAGAAAASVWAAQQPLDMRLFGVPYDDAELLATAAPLGPWTKPLGYVLHATNGAIFGAIYAQVAPRLPGPAWLRGATAGMVEHGATWPTTRFIPRFHPLPDRFPLLWGSRAALAQATWRHLLFGVVLGELEARLNPPEPEPEPEPAPVAAASPGTDAAATNGHAPVDDERARGLV
jgi:hypothetical protein